MLSPAEYYSLLPFKDSPLQFKQIENKSDFYSLKDKQCIEAKYSFQLGSPVYVITTKGRDELLQFEQARDENAKKEKQQRFSNKLAVADVLVPFVGFILGLVVEHYSAIFSMFVSLFHH